MRISTIWAVCALWTLTAGAGTTPADTGQTAHTICTITGTTGPDVLTGTGGPDVVCGLGGRDVIFGGGGGDVLRGGAGRDELHGNEGDDVLVAGRGEDTLRGGGGSDTLRSRDNRPFDVLDGGPGTNLCEADASDHRHGCRRPLAAGQQAAVPILMYHVIAANHGQPYPQLYVSPSLFAAQMAYLAHHGFHVVTLQEVYDYWHGAPLPRKPVVVSFDDGFRNQYTKAMPILSAYGWSGTLNLAVSHLSAGTYGLGPNEVRTLIDRGWEIDSHTMSHARLPGLPASALAREVGGSRAYLRRHFGVPVRFFCYPGGAFDTTVIGAVRRAGYAMATSTIEGFARFADAFTLRRVRITSSDGVAGLAAKLNR